MLSGPGALNFGSGAVVEVPKREGPEPGHDEIQMDPGCTAYKTADFESSRVKVLSNVVMYIYFPTRLRQEDCHEFKTGLHSETLLQTNKGRTKSQKPQRLPGGGREEAGTRG